MTLGTILSQFFLGPLKLLFEVIFHFANDLLQNPGFAIIFLSLSVNLLVLPLYRRADVMQEKARDTEAALHDGIAHIKKTFSGNERMMMLQTYYRQNDYSPTHVMRGSVSLFLQIPFFMAAYQFLSHLDALQGVSFGPIQDLGVPDGLLKIGSLQLNLLPILMTLINFISSAIYLKGFPLKTKVQLYGLAIFFLVFLYSSPAGLLFYWTLNNVFSLLKNIFFKVLKNPKKVLAILTAVLGAGAIALYFGANAIGRPILHRKIVLLLGLALELPLLLRVIHPRRSDRKAEAKTAEPSRASFLLAALLLTVLLGVLIPSNYLAASPSEYVDVTYFFHPLWFLVSALCIAGGFFLFWFGIFYWLASPRGKVIMERLLWVLCGIALINNLFFGTKLGIISSTLKYDDGLTFSSAERWINLAVVAAAAVVLYLLAKKWRKLPVRVLAVALIALTVMSVVNTIKVQKEVSGIKVQDTGDMPHFTLSKKGKNVVVIFIDRALGTTVPFIMKEKPELMETFDGFTYYDNVISFGMYTNFGTPPMLGGYEYTPVEMNKRDTEPLVEKHNEALKVMPTLFSQSGYHVTICDPPYANYRWIPDLSIYDDMPGVNAYITKGAFGDRRPKQQAITANLRNFFCFSVMRASPVFIQPMIYRNGTYWRKTEESIIVTPQEITDEHTAYGYNPDFMETYQALCSLDAMTVISNGDDCNFLYFGNNTPHEPTLLPEPAYEPDLIVDNAAYDEAHADRFTTEERSIDIIQAVDYQHYQINMAALLQIGHWLDYLRENDVYDNTRIIIVSDHGRDIRADEVLVFRDEEEKIKFDGDGFFPLLMVKDFNSTGFTTDHTFMTNADTPLLTMDGVIEDLVNPFTGKVISNEEKTAHPQFITRSRENMPSQNHGNTFIASTWVSVHDSIWDRDNWTFYDEESTIPE